MKKIYALVGGVACILLFISTTTFAETHTVTFCGDGNDPGMLRSKINNAKDGDAIIIPSFKTLLGTQCTIILVNGALDISKSLTIEAQGEGTIIDADSKDHVFHITSGTVTLKNLTIQNGDVLGWATENYGGGIYITGGDVTVDHCLVTANKAGFGGGIGIIGGEVKLIDSTVDTNSATNDGGIYIWHDSIAKILRSTISNNSATWVGGIFNQDGKLYITNSTISGNSASGSTGVGGISTAVGYTYLNNSTISNNSASLENGIGGLYLDFHTVSAKNSIIAGNTGFAPDCGGNTITSLGYNLVGNGLNCKGTKAEGDLIGSVENPIDPKLGALTDNGSTTKTHALLAGSPAINAGDPAGCKSSDGILLTTDQRGEKRDSKCDIGAYEYTKSVISSSDMVVDFESVKVGESYPHELTAYNKGNGTLIISSSVLSDTTNFTMTGGGSNPCTGEPPTVAPDSSCTGLLTFKPTSADTFSATLTIASNDPDTPSLQIALSGVGVAKTEETTETPAQCGDGITQVGSEDCDDGNVASGDGCSSACKTEKAVTTTTVCGNGSKEGDEACDDGNTADGDGCSSACKNETATTSTTGATDSGTTTGTSSTEEPASGGGCSLIR